jgi:hypothetical protein
MPAHALGGIRKSFGATAFAIHEGEIAVHVFDCIAPALWQESTMLAPLTGNADRAALGAIQESRSITDLRGRMGDLVWIFRTVMAEMKNAPTAGRCVYSPASLNFIETADRRLGALRAGAFLRR